ncbi:UDP-glucose 4-epimerase GalE [Veronia pacifica]|uniref:UDP-glucose 4-epimerase n=1 Tax=Veronia pacifica TaxID=1080227 RepID=A0A1C3ER66_9GAMM|nr:UDP-glucose 4-epimerase GalE [Veronia pacifica]ODA35689.1 UDP-glucose 4-epimerase GalE [Veronia pacifica]
MNVLVTGGLGYIGSHTVVQLIENGFTPVIVDNLANSSIEVLDRIKALTDHQACFYEADVRDEKCLEDIFSKHNIDGVMHFAGLKSVAESVADPLTYFDNNVSGSLSLVRAMTRANVKCLIFSSSATVYGEPERVPITEEASTGNIASPYGRSKHMVEQCLTDLQSATPDSSICLLRYFNPVGAHPSGVIGEDPKGTPNNLMPFIAQVAVGKREKLSVFGNDYPTPDGTGIRDYIHVMDLAAGHVAAFQKLADKSGLHVFNLGTGKGTSVMQMIYTFSVACDANIPFEICPRRAGDIAEYWADPSKASRELDWHARYSLMEMAEDTWRWQVNNPNGYTSPRTFSEE